MVQRIKYLPYKSKNQNSDPQNVLHSGWHGGLELVELEIVVPQPPESLKL